MGCGAPADKPDLLRVVLVDGRVEPDPEQRRPGRGAYVCDRDCADQAIRRSGFQRSFRCAVRIDSNLVDSL